MSNNGLITVSKESKGRFGVVGHVGSGHVHSHSGFTQDDSAGFAVVASIIKEAVEANTVIRRVSADLEAGSIRVETFDGAGQARARRGFTPIEQALAQRAVGKDAVYAQAVAINAFGRMYGQGISEPAVALESAAALAVLDALTKKASFHVMEAIEDKLDTAAGIALDVFGVPVAFLLVINATDGGIGPDEDYEGNSMQPGKDKVMRAIGLDRAPTIVVESKAFIPMLAQAAGESHFLIRAQAGVDRAEVASALRKACSELEYSYLFKDDVLPQAAGQLREATAAFADRVIGAAQRLKSVDSSRDKVRIIGELAKLISEDAGGISFMSNSLNEIVRGPGLEPGTGAVLSMIVTEEYQRRCKIPVLDEEDVRRYRSVICHALEMMNQEVM